MSKNFKLFESLAPIDVQKLRGQRNYLKVDKPSRPFKARMYGYRSNSNYVIIHARILKGGIEPCIPVRGRNPSKIYAKYSRNIPLKQILQNRVSKRFTNLKHLRSYYLAEDGQYFYYEHVMKIIPPKKTFRKNSQ